MKVKYTMFVKTLTVIPPTQNPVILKADTGASTHYIKQNEKHILAHRKYLENGPNVDLPNRSTMNTVDTGILPSNEFLSK